MNNKKTVQRDEVHVVSTDGAQLIRVAGVSFRPGYPDNLTSLVDRYPDGQVIPVVLEREPSNPYDERAVKVLIEGEHVGYVPKAINAPITEALDAGEAFTCRVEEVPISKKGGASRPGLIIHVVKTAGVARQ